MIAEAKRGDSEFCPLVSFRSAHLIRVSGRRDLVLLFVVAVFNLNVVPSRNNNGVTVWLWIISLVLFLDARIAVDRTGASLSPEKAGSYLWRKEVF